MSQSAFLLCKLINGASVRRVYLLPSSSLRFSFFRLFLVLSVILVDKYVFSVPCIWLSLMIFKTDTLVRVRVRVRVRKNKKNNVHLYF